MQPGTPALLRSPNVSLSASGYQSVHAPPEAHAGHEHCPTLPVALQAPPGTLQASLQQTPSTQLPDWHWGPDWQTDPLPRRALQVLVASQKCVGRQSLGWVHVDLHVVEPSGHRSRLLRKLGRPRGGQASAWGMYQ